jgi:hypothetical protein
MAEQEVHVDDIIRPVNLLFYTLGSRETAGFEASVLKHRANQPETTGVQYTKWENEILRPSRQEREDPSYDDLPDLCPLPSGLPRSWSASSFVLLSLSADDGGEVGRFGLCSLLSRHAKISQILSGTGLKAEKPRGYYSCLYRREGLFADLGALMQRALQLSSLAFAFPYLLLGYISQGAYICDDRPAWTKRLYNA